MKCLHITLFRCIFILFVFTPLGFIIGYDTLALDEKLLISFEKDELRELMSRAKNKKYSFFEEQTEQIRFLGKSWGYGDWVNTKPLVAVKDKATHGEYSLHTIVRLRNTICAKPMRTGLDIMRTDAVLSTFTLWERGSAYDLLFPRHWSGFSILCMDLPPSSAGFRISQSQVQSKTLLLWENGAPGARGAEDIDKPTITIYFSSAQTTNRPAIVICPGGAYGMLAISYEGHDVARWLNQYDIVGIVLQYRISPYRHPAPMLDGQRAIRLVRAKANEWGIDPHKIGMMGFSAGGHLASTVATHFDMGNPEASDPIDRYSCRPDFLILVYPVITMGKYTHAGSRRNLIGNKLDPKLIEFLSNEKHVTADTPPVFIVHSQTDNVVSVENSRMFYSALLVNKIPAEFFELSDGDHGLGHGEGELWIEWQTRCLAWMKRMKIIQ